MSRWGDEKTLRFIHLYQERECLWNTQSPHYKNLLARELAYKSMLEAFKDDSLNIKNIKTKIKNLRSVYHTELKKVNYYLRCGRIFTPTLAWFDAMDAFIGRSLDKRHVSTATPAVNTSAQAVTAEAPAISEDNSCGTSTQDSPMDYIIFQGSLEPNLDPLQDIKPIIQTLTHRPKICTTSTVTQSSSDHQYARQTKRKVYRRNKTHADNAILNSLQRVENRLNNVVDIVQQVQPRVQQEDEFYVFALSVAAQLRQLPLHIAVGTQTKIQSTLAEARLASIRSTLAPSPSPSLSIKTEELSN